MVEIGKKYKFAYPEEFTSLPEYSARRGSIVEVVRPLAANEAHPPVPEQGITQMYKILADDGWEGDAYEEELIEIK